ncbi:unnamed protein product [Spirodela intermedia]|uniref:Uncharacterized protein n=1 Tax=Spirodela intermedia TaxID=51605 RepID=A0A7I8JN52_SPIIN|nr:unnamed protein product [Spirodela intermedia]CAA6671569.1 unnamed protein product [Spirodela intermedia]
MEGLPKYVAWSILTSVFIFPSHLFPPPLPSHVCESNYLAIA